jgi:hypothetical protein
MKRGQSRQLHRRRALEMVDAKEGHHFNAAISRD